MASGCGSIGKAVASNTRGPRFKSSHRQNLYWIFVYLFIINSIEKTKINKKRPELPTFKKNVWHHVPLTSPSPSRLTSRLLLHWEVLFPWELQPRSASTQKEARSRCSLRWRSWTSQTSLTSRSSRPFRTRMTTTSTGPPWRWSKTTCRSALSKRRRHSWAQVLGEKRQKMSEK